MMPHRESIVLRASATAAGLWLGLAICGAAAQSASPATGPSAPDAYRLVAGDTVVLLADLCPTLPDADDASLALVRAPLLERAVSVAWRVEPSWTFAFAPPHSDVTWVTARVDPGQTLRECDETNNEADVLLAE